MFLVFNSCSYMWYSSNFFIPLKIDIVSKVTRYQPKIVHNVSHNNCSLAGCYGEWRTPASVTSPVWRNPIHRNPFLIINQIHKYTQMTYECTKLLCVSPTRFYHDSFSFKENNYPVLNQRHISVDIRTAPFFYRSQSREIAFFKTDPSIGSGLLHTVASHILAIATREFFRWARARAVSVWYLDLHY